MCVARAEIYLGRGKPEDFQKLRTSANPYYRAMAAAIGGAKSDALSALEDALAAHTVMLAMIGTEPAFDSLRGEARFRAIQRRVGMQD
jgi:hypothetical protein